MGGVPTKQHVLRLRKHRSPIRQITMFWKEPSDELDRVIAELASTFWIHVAYAKRGVEIRELTSEELTAAIANISA
jgi:hypothetical protein